MSGWRWAAGWSSPSNGWRAGCRVRGPQNWFQLRQQITERPWEPQWAQPQRDRSSWAHSSHCSPAHYLLGTPPIGMGKLLVQGQGRRGSDPVENCNPTLSSHPPPAARRRGRVLAGRKILKPSEINNCRSQSRMTSWGLVIHLQVQKTILALGWLLRDSLKRYWPGTDSLALF